jgi:hypothetical protein
MTEAEFVELRRSALGFCAAPVAPDTLSLENEQTRLRKELQANIRRWIGSVESPWISHELWDSIETTPDERLRKMLAQKVSKTELDRLVRKTFWEAGRGKTPALMTDAHPILQKFMRRWLLELAAPLAASTMVEGDGTWTEPEKVALESRVLSMMLDEDAGIRVSSFVASLKHAVSEMKTVKRLREDEEGPKATGKASKPASKTAAAKKAFQEGRCFKCEQKGHRAANCPN